MKVQIEKLRHVLQFLKPMVPRKANMAVLTHVRLGEGKVSATDLEVYVTVSGVGEPADGEAVCLPYGLLVDLLAAIPGYEVANITREGKLATIALGNTTATLNALPGTDFPPVPEFTPEHDVAVDGDALVRCLTAVAPYAVKEDSRPVLTAVCLTLGDKSEAVAADGFRLAWQPAPKLPGEEHLLIPRQAVAVLQHLWKHAPKPVALTEVADVAHLAIAKRLVRLAYSQTPQKNGAPPRRLRVTFGEVSLHVELISGTYPKYQQLIPDYTPSAVFYSADLLQALRSVAPMARDGFVTLSTDAPSKPGLLSYRGIPDVVVMPMFVQPEGKPLPAKPNAEATTPGEPRPEVSQGCQAQGPEPQSGGPPSETTPPPEPVTASATKKQRSSRKKK